MPNLASLARGLGGGSFGVVGGGEGKKGKKQKSTGEKGYLDIEEFGGKVAMSADVCPLFQIANLCSSLLIKYRMSKF